MKNSNKKIFTGLSIILGLIILFLIFIIIPNYEEQIKYQEFRYELEFLEDQIEDKEANIRVGIDTPRDALEEISELEKEFEDIKKEIGNSDLDEFYKNLLETWESGVELELTSAKGQALRTYMIGNFPTEREFLNWRDWSWSLSQAERETAINNIRR